MKVCSKCGQEKELLEFNKHSESRYGVRPECKQCVSAWKLRYRIKNREMLAKKDKEYAAKNPDKVRAIKQRWAENNPDKVKASGKKFRLNHSEKEKLRHHKYSTEHADKIKEKSHRAYIANPERLKRFGEAWRANNPEKFLESCRQVSRKIRATPEGKLNNTMGRSMWTALKEIKAGRCWESLIGYTVNDLRKHLETQFNNGMSWENYGTFWHIDHIIPKSAFRFKIAEDEGFKKCWGLENLRPLEARENMRKHNKIVGSV